jgi:hypothetical protein
MGWAVNATLRSLYPKARPGTHCTGGWVGPRPVLEGAEHLATTGIRAPDGPARSESLNQLSYPAPVENSWKTELYFPVASPYCQ